MIDWGAIETAIHTWVAGASGVAAIWADQNGIRPNPPFILMSLPDFRVVGMDGTVASEETPGSPVVTQIGNRAATLTLESYAQTATGASSARGLLALVQSLGRLPSHHDVLKNANIGLLRFEQIINISNILGTSRTEPRASLDVRLSLTSEALEATNIIETAAVDNTTEGSTLVIP